MYNSTFSLNSALGGGWVVNATPRLLYPQERPGALVQETEWAPGTVWTGAEKMSPPTGIGSPDRPARNESLYQLSCLKPSM